MSIPPSSARIFMAERGGPTQACRPKHTPGVSILPHVCPSVLSHRRVRAPGRPSLALVESCAAANRTAVRRAEPHRRAPRRTAPPCAAPNRTAVRRAEPHRRAPRPPRSSRGSEPRRTPAACEVHWCAAEPRATALDLGFREPRGGIRAFHFGHNICGESRSRTAVISPRFLGAECAQVAQCGDLLRWRRAVAEPGLPSPSGDGLPGRPWRPAPGER